MEFNLYTAYPLRHQFDKGKRDFYNGKLTCRYKPGTDRYREWLRGFNTAYFECLDKWTKGKKKE